MTVGYRSGEPSVLVCVVYQGAASKIAEGVAFIMAGFRVESATFRGGYGLPSLPRLEFFIGY